MIDVWIPAPDMSPIEFQGHCEFRDIIIPIPGKDEWGVDTLQRTVQGPASRIAQFNKTLKQGATYKDANGNTFFLQTWQPIEHKCFPGAHISYKGLINDALPDPIPSTTNDEKISIITAGNLQITMGSEEDGTERIIIGGTREIKYVSTTTIWRYVSRGEPKGRKFENVRGNVRQPMLITRGSVIYAEYEDGGSQRYVGSAPAALATALFVTPYVETTGPSFFPIIGTPFYECEEICAYRYPDS